MDALVIKGPAKLAGKVEVSGSKNSALPMLFAALLFDKEIHYENVPRLWDIETTLKILKEMGSETDWNKEEGRVRILPKIQHKVAPYELVRQMRAGILALGPLVAKYGEARVSLPGGCAIGARPVNYHLEAMRKMGVSVAVDQGYVTASVLGKLQGAEYRFPQVSVTGTENIMMLATAAEGTTRIENAAREPEIIALGRMLEKCGARIRGLGSATIEIVGTPIQPPVHPVCIPADRIEAGTWIAIAAATRNPLEITKCDAGDMGAVLSVFREIGVGIEISPDGKTLRVTPREKYDPVRLSTAPYPGFPTDMQAQLMAVLCLAEGRSRIEETIFENRFMHVAELRRLGASIDIEGKTALINGPVKLKGAPLMATDLRASASLVVAALAAEGESKISRIYHLDRGYQKLELKLKSVGATIHRVTET